MGFSPPHRCANKRLWIGENQISGHHQSQNHKSYGHAYYQARLMQVQRIPCFQLFEHPQMAKCGEQADGDAHQDQRDADPQGNSILLHLKIRLEVIELLEKQPKPSEHKSQPHQSDACANPRQHGTFRDQVVACAAPHRNSSRLSETSAT
jgi:hypothetical protein